MRFPSPCDTTKGTSRGIRLRKVKNDVRNKISTPSNSNIDSTSSSSADMAPPQSPPLRMPSVSSEEAFEVVDAPSPAKSRRIPKEIKQKVKKKPKTSTQKAPMGRRKVTAPAAIEENKLGKRKLPWLQEKDCTTCNRTLAVQDFPEESSVCIECYQKRPAKAKAGPKPRRTRREPVKTTKIRENESQDQQQSCERLAKRRRQDEKKEHKKKVAAAQARLTKKQLAVKAQQVAVDPAVDTEDDVCTASDEEVTSDGE